MFVFAFVAAWLGFTAPAPPIVRDTGNIHTLQSKAVPAGSSCVGAPQGLIAWWALDEITGTVSRDLIAAQHGQHHGHPQPVSGVVDGGLSFDGSQDYIEVPYSPLLNLGTGDFSIDAWVRTVRVDQVRVIVDRREIDGNHVAGYLLFLYQGRLGLQIADGTFANYISHVSVADGLFHHVAVTVSRHEFNPFFGATFYIDGVEVDSYNVNAHSGSLDPPLFDALPLWIGASSEVPSSFFDGEIDEVEIFNRELRRAEVADIAQAGSAGKCKCAALATTPVAWWPFDEPDGATKAADIAGHFTGPHDVSLTGTTLATGMVQGARSFNGTSDFASAEGPLDPDLANAGGYTVDAWIRTSQANAVLISNITAPTDFPIGYTFSLSGGALSIGLEEAGASCTVPACSGLADNAWHLVGATLTYDRGGKNVVFRLFVDGQLAQAFPPVNVIPAISRSGFAIGFFPAFGRGTRPTYYQGLLDELEVFDHALTEADFSAIYTAGRGGKCKPAARPGICGLPGATPCAAGQYCDFLLGAGCSVGSVGGFCRNRPEVCTFDENPVCGCDGKTYGNTCGANYNGISVAYPGPCH